MAETTAARGGAGAGPAGRRMKLHSLDALRGFMLAMVVVGHAGVSFGVNCRENVWKACDDSQSFLLFPKENFVLDLWAVSMFGACLPTFFLLAGLYGMVLYKKVGAVAFIRNRLTFIVLPFVVACVVLIPISQFVGLYGDAWKAPPDSPKADFAESATRFFTSSQFFEYFTLNHLWFLYYLLLCYAAFVVTAPLWDPLLAAGRTRRALAWLFGSPFRVLVLAVPTALLMLPMANLIDTPSGVGWRAFAVRWDILAFYYFFFLIGGALARQPRLIPMFWRRWLLHALLGLLVALPAAMVLFGLSVVSPGQYDQWMQHVELPGFVVGLARSLVGEGGDRDALQFLLRYAYATYSWLLIFGIYGFFNRFFGTPRAWVRFVVESSYWLYLAHWPIVIYLQIVVQEVALPPLVKFVGVVAVTFALLFVAFEFVVRPTPLGRLLGAKPRRRPAPA